MATSSSADFALQHCGHEVPGVGGPGAHGAILTCKLSIAALLPFLCDAQTSFSFC